MESPFLIVGLGNPGKQYSKTRHNSGFMVADYLAAQFNKSFTKFKNMYWVTSFDHQQQTIILMKPATFMNLSGLAVAAGVGRYGVTLSNLLVICDDLNLKFGAIRLRANGSDGGQKGLRSIISTLGTQDFPRLRIGIDNHIEDAVEYVLSPFSKNEWEYLPDIIKWAAEAVESFVLNGIEITMSRFNKNYLSRLE
jgi:PTH1 family peptidyl-tRNA hydrolase